MFPSARMCFACGVRITFQGSPEPTVGVEWEFALVDKSSRDLASSASDLLAAAGPKLADPTRLHKELLRNTVEVVSGVCRTAGEAVADLRHALETVVPVADELGVDLYGGGTHPFASWTGQQLTEGHRYEELINRTQWWGRQMLIWGVHVHVGLPAQERVMPVLSSLLNHYPRTRAPPRPRTGTRGPRPWPRRSATGTGSSRRRPRRPEPG